VIEKGTDMEGSETEKQIVVLLVEDDPGDQKLVKSAIMNQEYKINLVVAPCGESALDYLQEIRKENSEKGQKPSLILLDLNMPGMGGKEFLRKVKADEELCVIPVVIVTTSDSETDIRECYALKAAGYIQKCAIPAEFREVIKKLTHYWFSLSEMVRNHMVTKSTN
jgi:CheY-like chemotaxis protein